MTFYERYEQLCLEKGYSAQSSVILEKIGLKSGTISGYKTSGKVPNGETLIKISRFFDVTIDYLLCETDVRNKAIDLSEQEQELINVFRSVSELDKFEIIELCVRLMKKTASSENSAV